MIDTITMIIPFDKVKVINYNKFGGRDKVFSLISSNVFCDSKNILCNNPTKEDNKIHYLPKIKIEKKAYPLKLLHDISYINVYIECSLAKILFNNNFEEISIINDFDKVLDKLMEKILYMGISIEKEILKKAYISRLDIGKNIIIKEDPRYIINIINKVTSDQRFGRINRDYELYGTSIKFFTKRYHVIVYDKLAEIKKALYYNEGKSITKENECQKDIFDYLEEKNMKIIRFEISLKRKKIKMMNLKIDNLEEAFNMNIVSEILRIYWDKIYKNINYVIVSNMETIFVANAIKELYPKITSTRLIMLVKAIEDIKNFGYDYMRAMYRMKSSEISKLKSEIKLIDNCIDKNIFQNNLYDDIKTIDEKIKSINSLKFKTYDNTIR